MLADRHRVEALAHVSVLTREITPFSLSIAAHVTRATGPRIYHRTACNAATIGGSPCPRGSASLNITPRIATTAVVPSPGSAPRQRRTSDSTVVPGMAAANCAASSPHFESGLITCVERECRHPAFPDQSKRGLQCGQRHFVGSGCGIGCRRASRRDLVRPEPRRGPPKSLSKRHEVHAVGDRSIHVLVGCPAWVNGHRRAAVPGPRRQMPCSLERHQFVTRSR